MTPQATSVSLCVHCLKFAVMLSGVQSSKTLDDTLPCSAIPISYTLVSVWDIPCRRQICDIPFDRHHLPQTRRTVMCLRLHNYRWIQSQSTMICPRSRSSQPRWPTQMSGSHPIARQPSERGSIPPATLPLSGRPSSGSKQLRPSLPRPPTGQRAPAQSSSDTRPRGLFRLLGRLENGQDRCLRLLPRAQSPRRPNLSSPPALPYRRAGERRRPSSSLICPRSTTRRKSASMTRRRMRQAGTVPAARYQCHRLRRRRQRGSAGS